MYIVQCKLYIGNLTPKLSNLVPEKGLKTAQHSNYFFKLFARSAKFVQYFMKNKGEESCNGKVWEKMMDQGSVCTFGTISSLAKLWSLLNMWNWAVLSYLGSNTSQTFNGYNLSYEQGRSLVWGGGAALISLQYRLKRGGGVVRLFSPVKGWVLGNIRCCDLDPWFMQACFLSSCLFEEYTSSCCFISIKQYSRKQKLLKKGKVRELSKNKNLISYNYSKVKLSKFI